MVRQFVGMCHSRRKCDRALSVSWFNSY